jgi:hypothetical protein
VTKEQRVKHRVLVEGGIDYPTDPAIVARLLAGEQVPWEERKTKHVAQGRVAGDIPACSVEPLKKLGWIEAVEEPD